MRTQNIRKPCAPKPTHSTHVGSAWPRGARDVDRARAVRAITPAEWGLRAHRAHHITMGKETRAHGAHKNKAQQPHMNRVVFGCNVCCVCVRAAHTLTPCARSGAAPFRRALQRCANT